MITVLIMKTVMDAGVAGFSYRNPPFALMFFGFAIADAGALWLAIKM
jgi:hypothetical protein